MMSDPDGTCQELVELVTNYLDGAMSAEELAQFERHLAQCLGCRHYLMQIAQTIALAAHPAVEQVEQVPEPVRARLLAAFRSVQAGDERPS